MNRYLFDRNFRVLLFKNVQSQRALNTPLLPTKHCLQYPFSIYTRRVQTLETKERYKFTICLLFTTIGLRTTCHFEKKQAHILYTSLKMQKEVNNT